MHLPGPKTKTISKVAKDTAEKLYVSSDENNF